MRNECSWTFWKGKSKIFNFHVGQNFDLKLAWTCKFEEKNFPFLVVENYRSLLFWETSCMTSNPSLWMFEMSIEACMDMNETFPTISHLQIPD